MSGKLRKVIIRDRRLIPPFNEPARDLMVMNKPLWLHQRDLLAPYCDEELEVHSLDEIPEDRFRLWCIGTICSSMSPSSGRFWTGRGGWGKHAAWPSP